MTRKTPRAVGPFCLLLGLAIAGSAAAKSRDCSANGLTMLRPGRPAAEYLPETADVFFLPGQPRSRRLFVRDETGKVIAMLDRREGEDIRWNRKS
jgi:hypothetical protein